MGDVIQLDGARAAAVRRRRDLREISSRLADFQPCGQSRAADDMAAELVALGRRLVELLREEQAAAASPVIVWGALAKELESVIDELEAIAAHLWRSAGQGEGAQGNDLDPGPSNASVW